MTKNDSPKKTKIYQMGKAYESDKVPIYQESSEKPPKKIKPGERPPESKEIPAARIIFMGTSTFAKIILEELIKSQHQIVAVITQPDREKSGQKDLESSPVKELAELRSIPLLQPEHFGKEEVSQIKKRDPNLIVVAAYGKILPKEILEIPSAGCLNVHASLLPRYRGPSPIQNALMAGENKTGVTVILMDKGIDTGDILSQQSIEISPFDNNETLNQKLAAIGANLLLKTIPMWLGKEIKPVKQDESKATLCQLIEREDGRIIWEEKAEVIYNRFRALHPWPGIFTFWKKDDSTLRLKLTKITLQKNTPQTPHRVGEIFQLGDKVGIQTAEGVIILEEIQIEGKKPVPVNDFLNGYPNFIGSMLV